MTRAAWEIWNVTAGLIAGALLTVAGVKLIRLQPVPGVPDGTSPTLVEIAHGLGWISLGLAVFVAASLVLRAAAPLNDTKGPPASH